MRILLAEDERPLGEWLAKALEQGGCRVDWCDDGRLVERALAELEARLTALVRRARGSEHPRLACGPLQFDTVTRQFTLSAEPLQLSPREHALLKALVQRSGEPLTRQQAMDRVFGDDEDVQPSVIDVLLHRLRKRLEGSGVRIHTYRGLGYVLELDTPGQH